MSTTSDLTPEVEALAERLVTTFAAGDMDGWLAAYAEDGVLWHSYDGRVKPAGEVAGMLREMFESVIADQRYEDVRRHRIAGGYVQQHTLKLNARSGATFETGVCIVVKVTNGKVERMDEYLDSSVFGFPGAHPDTP